MLVDMLVRARAMLRPMLPVAVLLATLLPAAADGQIPQVIQEQIQQQGGEIPDQYDPQNQPPGDTGGNPGDSGYGPGNGPGGASAAERMRRQIEALGRNRQQAEAADEGEQFIADELVIELPRGTAPEAIDQLVKRYSIALVEQLDSTLSGTIAIRARILDQRPVETVVRTVAADKAVISAQPNDVYRLQRAATPAQPAEPPLQYALGRLHLPQAHGVARGDSVLIGMIDSAVDDQHPDLAGSIAASFDATGGPVGPHSHGTAIASLIAGHGRLVGSAPAAHILAARAFDSANAKGNSFTVLKSLDWCAGRGARIVNMSFAGPQDPAVHRMLDGAWRRGITLVAAAGNAGPKSPPLYPAAEPHVIAVTATDAGDRLFAQANRGAYVAVAAPGVDLFVAAPDGGYAILSGTSFSAAEVSGIAALMIQRRPKLGPDALRAQLTATARVLAPGLRLADAYKAVTLGQTAR
jgi:subtilisin family serine protease